MNRLIQITIFTFATLTLTACIVWMRGSGIVKTETRDVSGFDEVELTSFGKMIITQTGSESLTVEAEDNLLEYITTEVRGNRLVIGTRSNINIKTTRPVIYRLNVKNLESVALSGSGSIETGDIMSDRLVADISGSGKITLGKVSVQRFSYNGSGSGSFESRGIDAEETGLVLTGSGEITIENLEANNLTVDQSSSGSIRLDGNTGNQEISLTGSGSYQAENLDSRRASVTVSGSGSAAISVSDQLNANISGSGSITYSGDPEIMKRVTGSGSVGKR